MRSSYYTCWLKAVPVDILASNLRCEWWNRDSVHRKCETNSKTDDSPAEKLVQTTSQLYEQKKSIVFGHLYSSFAKIVPLLSIDPLRSAANCNRRLYAIPIQSILASYYIFTYIYTHIYYTFIFIYLIIYFSTHNVYFTRAKHGVGKYFA